MASGCADEIAHANEGETSARRVATRPRPGTPAPDTGETPARRVATTPRPCTPAPNTGPSEKAGKPAKEDRRRDGRPGRGLDE